MEAVVMGESRELPVVALKATPRAVIDVVLLQVVAFDVYDPFSLVVVCCATKRRRKDAIVV
jgi:hypothetical protein